MHSKTQDQKEWRPKELFIRTFCGVHFTTIVTDSTNIYSALTHFPSAWPERFTQCQKKYMYNYAPVGKYCYKLLSMGTSNPPEIFQEKMRKMFQGFGSIPEYIDDLFIIYMGNCSDHL